jgi:hypothetical protein
MRNPCALLTCLLVIVYSFSHAQKKDTARLGIYINSIYDFKLDDKSFMADLWLWINYKNDSLQFENTVEIPNSKTVEFSHYTKEKVGEWNWITQKCKAQIMHQWDVSCFPFDKQHLRIEIEDSEYDASQLVYTADRVNSRIDTAFNSNEWHIEKFLVYEDVRIYQTTYGNPALSGKSSYPRLVAEIVIQRNNSWIMLAKMLTGAYVAFFISCLVFFVSSDNQDSRFGLCVGALFAAIGNKYIVESIVPTSTTNSLMDNVHNLTFTFILLIVVIIVISLSFFESEDERKKNLSLRLDKYAFFSTLILYCVINALLIFKASS